MWVCAKIFVGENFEIFPLCSRNGTVVGLEKNYLGKERKRQCGHTHRSTQLTHFADDDEEDVDDDDGDGDGDDDDDVGGVVIV